MATRAHELFLDIPHTNNPKIFKVIDSSIYSDLIAKECGNLQITPPGFKYPTSIEVPTYPFNITLSACSLGIQLKNCATESQNLPDGIYIVRYSVSPNDKIYVEYHHLRTTQFTNKYNMMLCSLEMAACEPDADVKDKLTELRLIDSMVKAAKVKVEDCHDYKDGMDLFIYAQKRLAKLDGINC
jgi:hypothetical protein